jgi:predicted phage gp36 major capsid-like protein
MNKERRKKIADLILQLQAVQSDIEELQAEEQDCFDNLTEGLQATERGEKMEATAESLSEAGEAVDEVISALEAAAE